MEENDRCKRKRLEFVFGLREITQNNHPQFRMKAKIKTHNKLNSCCCAMQKC